MAKKSITTEDLELLKDLIQQESIITRRTIVKNAQKTDPWDFKRRVVKEEQDAKRELQLRKKYPSINEAYKNYKEAYRHYRFLMKTVE
tara:strand:+ start:1100 stop:1363 length:264 start_codon:yes stop_codon:yes gene_type:complete